MDVSKSDILEMLAREVESEPMRPDEFTVDMFVERTGYSENGARCFLDKKVKSGLLTVRKVRGANYWVNVYGKKEQ